VASCYADPYLAADELGWKAEFDLERMCKGNAPCDCAAVAAAVAAAAAAAAASSHTAAGRRKWPALCRRSLKMCSRNT